MSDQLNNPARNNEKHDHDYRIIVNGEKKIVESDVISYDAVVLLAYPTPPAPNTIIASRHLVFIEPPMVLS